MWEFVQSAPWTFGTAGVLLLVSVIAVVVGIVTKGGWLDRGLMTTTGGNKLKWDRRSFPLSIWLHNDIPSVYRNAYVLNRAFINAHAPTIDLFDAGTDAPEGFKFEHLLNGHVGIVMSDAVQTDNPDHGSTTLVIDKQTGQITSALIALPPNRDALASPIMLHELMHALGFDHDEQTGSLMHPRLQLRPQKITKSDLEILGEVTDTEFSDDV